MPPFRTLPAIAAIIVACWQAQAPAQQVVLPPTGPLTDASPTNFPASTIVSSNSGNSIFNGVNLNALTGAERFYMEGYSGTMATIANVEAGHVWNGHESLEQVSTYIQLSDVNGTRQYDWHATMVGHILNGQSPYWLGYGWLLDGMFNTSTWYGIAPGATLWSTAIATGWNPDPDPVNEYTGSFNISAESLMYGYNKVMAVGVNGKRADVVNSSWGQDDPAGQAWETMVIDALAYANHTTVVLAAGNHDAGTAQVGGPASGYNSIAVAAMTGDALRRPYSAVAPFSNSGPNDYVNAATGLPMPPGYVNPKTGTVVPTTRARIDIAAPGDNMTLAFYGGLTGGHTSGTDPTVGDYQGLYYIPDMGGTSFASPIVAGGAALLVDVGYQKFGGGNSIDGRVIKAVLLNSADKPDGWDNGQHMSGGVLTTTQSLDYATGAGVLNLNRAFDQYTAGTADVPGLGGGTVRAIGWDFGLASAGQPNEYRIDHVFSAGNVMTVTLDWFVNRVVDPISLEAGDVQFDDLDLQVWRLTPDGPVLVAQSISQFNNVEHLDFALPQDGTYELRVVWYGENYNLDGGPDADNYALAWSVTPEPGTFLLLLPALPAVLALRWRRRRAG